MDFKTLGENLGLEEDEFMELVELFATSAAEDIEKLQAAYNQANAAEVAEAAHSLKGSAGNLGFTEFSVLAKKAEDNARNNNLENPTETVSGLKENLSVISRALEKYNS